MRKEKTTDLLPVGVLDGTESERAELNAGSMAFLHHSYIPLTRRRSERWTRRGFCYCIKVK